MRTRRISPARASPPDEVDLAVDVGRLAGVAADHHELVLVARRPRRAPRARGRRARVLLSARSCAAASSACGSGRSRSSRGHLVVEREALGALLVGVAEHADALELAPTSTKSQSSSNSASVSPGWPTMNAVRNVEVGDASSRMPLDDALSGGRLPWPRRMRLSIASDACCSGMSTYGTTRGWLASSSMSASSIVSGYR